MRVEVHGTNGVADQVLGYIWTEPDGSLGFSGPVMEEYARDKVWDQETQRVLTSDDGAAWLKAWVARIDTFGWLYAVVTEEKYNPYHDARGRFASGPGGAAADRLESEAREHGFTIRTSDGFMPKEGFAVAIAKYGESFSAAEMTRPELESRCSDYFARNASVLGQDGMYAGGWLDKTDGSVWLDVSRVFGTQAEAEAFGRAQGERAVFNLKDKVEIRLDGKGRKASEPPVDHDRVRLMFGNDPKEAADLIWQALHEDDEK